MGSYRHKYEVKAAGNPFLPAHEVVKEVLRDDICTCVLAPGARLKEMELSEQFGVSRTTIRRAFETLLNEEWLVHNGKQGVKVTPMSRKQYKEMVEVRSSLDSFAARLASVRRTPQDLAELQTHVRLPEDADYLQFYKTDVAFHKAIYYASHNEYLVKIYEHISFDLARVKSFITGGELTLEDKLGTNEEHRAILDAISHRDKKLAHQLALGHSRMVLTNTINLDFDADELF